MNRIILEKEELRRHLKTVAKNPDINMSTYYTNRCIRKYSKAEQDMFMDEIYKTILEIPGGYWQIIDNMNFMPMFEHYSMRGVASYTKGNVCKTMAKRELSPLQYRKLYKEFEDII